ncbi:MAG: Holliday junction branch migration protein RuvA [Candidatus Malihini olakiniferum]
MIGHLRGIILEKEPPKALLEVNGVGYEIHMPMTCFYELPELKKEAVIFTQFIVREDAQLLFGFIEKQKQTLFRELIKTNGVGPKLALAILSGLSVQEFMNAVKGEEITTLIKLPGVGKKTAKRLVVEIKDRFKGISKDLFNPSTTNMPSSNLVSSSTFADNPKNEAASALVKLGYKPREAIFMVSKIAHPDADCETLIRDALRAAL